jgi:hypothetical protein
MVVDATERRGHMGNKLGGMLFGFGERVPRRDAPRAEDGAHGSACGMRYIPSSRCDGQERKLSVRRVQQVEAQ